MFQARLRVARTGKAIRGWVLLGVLLPPILLFNYEVLVTGNLAPASAPSGCSASSATWSERSRPRPTTPTGLLAVRLADRSVSVLLSRRDRLDHPAFSPDGRYVAVLGHGNGLIARLELCDLRRRSITELRTQTPVSNFSISFGPSSKTLFFLGGDILGYGADQRPFRFDIVKRHLQQLGGDSAWYWDGAVPSPDGRKLALLLALKNPGGEEPERLVVYDPATGSFQRVAGSRDLAQIDSVSWSPDGTHIAFTAYKSDVHGDIYTVDVGRKQVTPLLMTGAGELSPAFSPDGRRIAYVRSPQGRPGSTSIWTYDLVTGVAERVTRGRHDLAPAWSPDGKEIAFVRRG
jgi:Tol biopolymer transport system component